MRKRRTALSVYLLSVVCGALYACAPSNPPAKPNVQATERDPQTPPRQPVSSPNDPISRQLPRASKQLQGNRFSGVLHFESEADEVFVSAEPTAGEVKLGDAHTGKAALLLPSGTQRLTIKLSSLLAGREFPGDWTLVGLYLRADGAAALTLSCEEAGGSVIAGRKLALPAGQWTPAMIDISALPDAQRDEVSFVLRFDEPTRSIVRCDDLVLIDNRQTLLDGGKGGWTIKRIGLRITCERPLRFNFGVVTADGSPQGWEVEEANDLRARFESVAGETKSLSVYADGRSYWDGEYKPLSAEVRDDKSFAAAHASPAEVSVPEMMGRLVRNTPGDANNDGYNEQLGAYQLAAAGARIEATLSPRTTAVPRPVLQVAGLPDGKALITIEGRLVERSTRLKDGQLLVELPARITRPTLVTIRIQ